MSELGRGVRVRVRVRVRARARGRALLGELGRCVAVEGLGEVRPNGSAAPLGAVGQVVLVRVRVGGGG